MNNSVEYKKSIEEARRSIEMLVDEYKETTMSPSLLAALIMKRSSILKQMLSPNEALRI